MHNPTDDWIDDMPVLFYAALGGQLNCVEWLLSRPGISVNSLRNKPTNDLVDQLHGFCPYDYLHCQYTDPQCTALSLAVEKGFDEGAIHEHVELNAGAGV